MTTKERLSANARICYLRHRERYLKEHREYYAKNREKWQIYKQVKNPRILLTIEEKRTKLRERVRKYRQTIGGREAILRAIRKYEASHPERRNAWNKANKLLKKPCIVCGEINTHRHHPDPLQPLSITYLCPLHHKQAHMI